MGVCFCFFFFFLLEPCAVIFFKDTLASVVGV